MPLASMRGSGGQFTTGRGIQWIGLEIVASNINKRGTSLNATRRKTVDKLSAEMLEWMQENAPWEDNTGMARDKLRADPVHDEREQTSTVYLAHGVDYGGYLETVNSGEFAILLPTIIEFQKKVVGTIKEVDVVSDVLSSLRV